MCLILILQIYEKYFNTPNLIFTKFNIFIRKNEMEDEYGWYPDQEL